MAKTIQEPRVTGSPMPSAPRRPPLAARVLVGLLAFFSIFLAVGAGYGFGLYVWADKQLNQIHVQGIGDLPCKNGCNYLILGSDSRKGLSKSEQILFGSETTVGGQRSDTIMLVHFNSSDGKAIVLSFPRDLWVDIPGVGYNKITSAIAFGGPGLTARTIHQLTGLRINGLVSINLAGFQAVVHALGGVPICVDRPMFDELAGLNLPHAGCYNLNGFQALAFVRARHVEGDCIPDFARISRQQQFLRAVINKVLSFRQALHAPSLIKAVGHNLTVSNNINLAELIKLTTQLKGVSTGAADFRAVPSTTDYIYVNGQGVSIVRPIQPDADDLFKRLRNGKPLESVGKGLSLTNRSPANIKVRVFDQDSGGRAARVTTYLQKGGFDVYGTNPAGVLGNPQPGIVYRAGLKPLADVVHGYLPTLTEAKAPKGMLSVVDVAVVIPASYGGPPLSALPAGGTGGSQCG